MTRIPSISFAALAAAAIAFPFASSAEPFTLFIYESAGQLALREAKTPEGAAYWQEWGAAGKAITDAGIVRGGSALSIDAPVGRVGGGASATQPVSAAALTLGGYFQIDVAGAAEALAWAEKLPVGEDGMVEVRAGYPVPGGM